jgi:hypothetical protein
MLSGPLSSEKLPARLSPLAERGFPVAGPSVTSADPDRRRLAVLSRAGFGRAEEGENGPSCERTMVESAFVR